MGQEATQNDLQAAIKLRGADVYADFLIPHLRPGATVLDCGCGAGTITLGLAEAVPEGHVVGVDLDLSGLKGAQRAAISVGQQNLSWIGADGRSLPFHGAIFDAVLCHSMLETLGDPAPVIAELRRVTKRGGEVGAASVEYEGIILAGESTAGPRRFYEIRQQLWRAARIAEPNTGKGMDAPTMVRALDPFFTTKPAGEGTGFGLPQVYGFATQSGGHLKIYSEVGEGTTIKLYLPRSLGQETVHSARIATLPVTGTETILLVGDDEIVQATVASMLEDLGYAVLRH